MNNGISDVQNLTRMLKKAHGNHYAVGSFSPRYTKLIQPIITAAMVCDSPAIVQLSEEEIIRHKVPLADFSEEFYRTIRNLLPEIPIALHLDRTRNIELIREAVDFGFTSVMVDASEMDFADNAAFTAEVTAFARPRNVTVEAALGRIGTTDSAGTDNDEELFTEPEEAARFIKLTGIDALAISVGTAHGLYTIRKPRIEYRIIRAVNALTDTPLVLPDGSGIPNAMLIRAVRMASGGISKVAIANDLEQAMLKELGMTGLLTEEETNRIDPLLMEAAQRAVDLLIEDRMRNCLYSAGKA